jgi:hypothetical protein
MKRNYVAILATVLLLTSCTFSQENKKSEEVFLSMFPNTPMNSDIRFWETSEEFTNGKSMALTLENISAFEVRFSDEYDVYAFVFEKNGWSKLENSAKFIPAEVERPLRPKVPDNPGVTAILLNPHLNDAELAPVNVRVTVIGTIYDNGQKTDKKTGAYIDVKLNP